MKPKVSGGGLCHTEWVRLFSPEKMRGKIHSVCCGICEKKKKKVRTC